MSWGAETEEGVYWERDDYESPKKVIVVEDYPANIYRVLMVDTEWFGSESEKNPENHRYESNPLWCFDEEQVDEQIKDLEEFENTHGPVVIDKDFLPDVVERMDVEEFRNMKGKGWRNEPIRHSLASQGIETRRSKI